MNSTRLTSIRIYIPSLLLSLLFLSHCTTENRDPKVTIGQGDHIVLIGNNLCSRMMNYGVFETEVHLRYPTSQITIRNMCDGGNTPGFRPHSGRVSPWAFPGAEKFQGELANASGSQGHFATPDEWLTRLEADVILAFFGFNESYSRSDGLKNFKSEIQAFIDHTKRQNYNGTETPELILVSPIAFEDISDIKDVPNGNTENANLQLYTNAMKEVAEANEVPFINAFTPTKKWFDTDDVLTIDGMQLNEDGNTRFSKWLAGQVFGKRSKGNSDVEDLVLSAVKEKNWFWHNDYKIPNGVHVFGRRYEPFGPDNYPAELTKVKQMTTIRDSAIWTALQGETMDVSAADANTETIPPVETNYQPKDESYLKYLYGDDAIARLKTAPGYQIELFASEKEFPDLANPVQMSFDNKGRLWVGVMPSYPHYKPGDSKPNDKLIILEDTDNDGKADNQITWADGLHLPIGFEIAPEGVYVSQGTNLILLIDEDGDDKADKKEILLSGFDDHDTHHAISAFCADPSGAIYMGEGVFLHTNVETAYGPIRATNGGFFRYAPQRHHLERTAQLSIPNPWGIAFDEWGQNFFAETSGPDVRWMMPGSVRPAYGVGTHKSYNLIEDAHRVRPTSGLEFVSSRHFPDEMQGDLLINNTIGFLGIKQHNMSESGTGYSSVHRQDLVVGSDPNFRPVDMEFAPDGSLYFIDWHNILIGHMQHNARDPLRDHVHGRVYRITYPSRPLVEPAKIADASIDELLENLKLPEYRSRYRTRRELRGRDSGQVLAALKDWVNNLDVKDQRYEHHLLEALWVSWGLNEIDEEILNRVLDAKEHKVRAAGARVLRYAGHQIENQTELLKQCAGDEHGRVRLEAIVAASWMSLEEGAPILEEAGKYELDDWMSHAYAASLARLHGTGVVEPAKEETVAHLEGDDLDKFLLGSKVYHRDGFCATCHQPDGKGLAASGFPPLEGTDWVNGDQEKLIKLTLKGLYGPIEVKGIKYPGHVPMTPFEGMLNDEEVSAVLTYVRNSFGNRSSVVSEEMVGKVRDEIQDKTGFYTVEELESNPDAGIQGQ